MFVRTWMTRDPVTVNPQTSVLYARRLLNANGVRHLPVVDTHGRVVGMVSDRDVLLRDDDVAQALSAVQSDLLSGRYRCVQTVMGAPVRGVGPDEPISLAAELLMRWRVSALAVVDRGRLVGILTTTDCLRALLSEVADDDRRRQVDLDGGSPALAGARPGR